MKVQLTMKHINTKSIWHLLEICFNIGKKSALQLFVYLLLRMYATETILILISNNFSQCLQNHYVCRKKLNVDIKDLTSKYQ